MEDSRSPAFAKASALSSAKLGLEVTFEGLTMCTRKMKQVTESMVERGERRADQLDVWANIAKTASRLQAASHTSAAEAIYERHAAALEDYVRACAPVERQSGAVFATGGRVAGLDLFDSAVTFRKLLPKLVRSYALDAIDGRGESTLRRTHPRTAGAAASLRAAANLFLRILAAPEAKSLPALGLGTDVRLVGPSLHGAALVHDEAVVHLCAFGD